MRLMQKKKMVVKFLDYLNINSEIELKELT